MSTPPETGSSAVLLESPCRVCPPKPVSAASHHGESARKESFQACLFLQRADLAAPRSRLSGICSTCSPSAFRNLSIPAMHSTNGATREQLADDMYPPLEKTGMPSSPATQQKRVWLDDTGVCFLVLGCFLSSLTQKQSKEGTHRWYSKGGREVANFGRGECDLLVVAWLGDRWI